MNLGKELLFFFSALGAFNGLILSCYFFFFVKKKQLSNYFLGAFLLALSLRVGKSVVYYFHGNLPKIYLQIGLTACFFIGPFLYFFLKSSINNLKTVPSGWKIHLAILAAIAIVGGLIVPYAKHPPLWWWYIIPGIYTQWAIYLVFSGFLLKDVFKKAWVGFSELKSYDIWLVSIFMSCVLILCSYVRSILGGGLYISAAMIFSFALYIAVFILMYRKKTDDLFSNTPKYAYKKVNETEARVWIQRLENLMLEKQLFKNPNLKLHDVAQEMTITAHQLSQFLNENMGKNFTLFVNEYRIQEACNILTSETNLSIEGISSEVGFNSKSTFFAAFKKAKGITPALYQQNQAKA